MNTRTVCFCIVAIVAVLALIILFYATGRLPITGAVSTGVCPPGSAVILAEGPGKWREEIRGFERLGHRCFFGYDGVTPCCTRTARCCLPFEEWQQR
jgi:hypothetical protein